MTEAVDIKLLEQEGEFAADYIETLLDIADLDGDIDMDVEGDRAVVSVIGGGNLDRLVGSHGEILDALQALTRHAVAQKTGVRSRLMVDIAGYRAAKRRELTDLGRQTALDVKDRGETVRLKPMTPFERKVVHDAVGSVDGVSSESEGEDPSRYVVVFLSDGASDRPVAKTADVDVDDDADFDESPEDVTDSDDE